MKVNLAAPAVVSQPVSMNQVQALLKRKKYSLSQPMSRKVLVVTRKSRKVTNGEL